MPKADLGQPPESVRQIGAFAINLDLADGLCRDATGEHKEMTGKRFMRFGNDKQPLVRSDPMLLTVWLTEQ
jgi:hypothetical protein